MPGARQWMNAFVQKVPLAGSQRWHPTFGSLQLSTHLNKVAHIEPACLVKNFSRHIVTCELNLQRARRVSDVPKHEATVFTNAHDATDRNDWLGSCFELLEVFE